MAHKHRPYTSEELNAALDEGNVTLERLAATVAGNLVRSAQPQNSGQMGQQSTHGVKQQASQGAKR